MRHPLKAMLRPLRAALVVAAVAAAGPSPASAQVAFGLNVGPSLTNLSGSLIESSELTAGIYVGATLWWQFSERWAVETGINSVQMGAFSVENADVEGAWDVKTSFLQVPARFLYLIPFANDKWVFAPFLGASYSFNGSCKIREAGSPIFDDECTEDTAFGPASSTDFQYSIGLLLDRVFGSSAFGFDIRYGRGTKDVLLGPGSEGLTSKNTVLDIKFRIVFPHFGDS
ncbi:MAG: PorT family protein [Gemmatimonadota bacterium]|nr:PorT family protein [Gemmatimonadota bacterium]